MCFLLISLCSLTTAALFTQTQNWSWGEGGAVVLLIYLTFVLHKHWNAPERWMRVWALVGGRSLWLWGLCHQEACSLLHLWHHCSIPFHRAGTTETPIKLLISCSPSPAHSRLPLYSNTHRILNPCSQIGSRFPAPDKPIIFFLCYYFTLGSSKHNTTAFVTPVADMSLRPPPLSSPYSSARSPSCTILICKEAGQWQNGMKSTYSVWSRIAHIDTVIVSQWNNAVGEGKKERGKGEKKEGRLKREVGKIKLTEQ